MEKLVDGKRREGHVNETGHLVAHGVGIERATDGVLHPCVCHKNPPRGDGGTEAREPRGGQMEAARHFLPAEKHHGNEGALHEESHDALDGKWRTEDVADKPGIVAPVGAKLKFEDDARGYAHGEVDAKQALPEDGGVFPKLFSCAIIAGFHNAHDEGKTQRERHEEPVVNGSECKLGTRPVDYRCVYSQKVDHGVWFL